MPKDWQTLDQKRQQGRTREQPKERRAQQAQRQEPKRRREQVLQQLGHPRNASMRVEDRSKRMTRETRTYSGVVGKCSNLVLFLAENSHRRADLDIFTLVSVEDLGDVARFNAIPGDDGLVGLNLVGKQE